MFNSLILDKELVRGAKLKIYAKEEIKSTFEFLEFLKLLKNYEVIYEVLDSKEFQINIKVDNLENVNYINIPSEFQSEFFQYYLYASKNPNVILKELGGKVNFIKNKCNSKKVYFYFNNGCPFSPEMMKSILKVAYICKNLEVYFINPSFLDNLFFEIRAVPYLVIEKNNIRRETYDFLNEDELINFILE